MELREALDSIATIRRRMAETEVFRGYRALPVAVSAILAVLAGLVQPAVVPRPEQDVPGYVGLWSVVALVSMGAAALAMFLRDRVAGTSLTRPVTWLAIGQFVPCLVAAAVVTVVIVRTAPESAWLLPGLWQVFFSQGIFASCRLLPRPAFAVGVFYLVAGTATLVLGRGDEALAPWAMAVPFGVGQTLAAAVLYWTLERTDGEATAA
ncbi:MAG: hypothetical protein J2P46_05395 [Zavarzinella sp.]|nr:hypothetical protein [Zavarzinella sp.]